MQQQGGLRGFFLSPIGRIALVALAVLITFATYVYISALLAIPILLVVGLAVPIWLGLKQLRFLAVLGLVVLLLVAPISTIVITQTVMTPIPPADSPSGLPGTTAPVMQAASVAPYLGSTSTNFTWTVTLYPAGIPKGNSSTNVTVDLYLSTCPGATGNNSPNCQAGYPLTVYTIYRGNLTSVTTVTFHQQIGSNGIWAWQMGMFLHNTTFPNENETFILLVGDPVYNGLEGPVVGGFWTTYQELILTVYLNDFVYLGIPFYVVLLIYAYIKRRQITRRDSISRAPGPTPTDSPGSSGSATATPTSAKVATTASRRPELSCPNCNAVVYANEKSCWKCGAALPGGGTSGATPASSPLPSNPPKPP